ncbi:hypothetical protein FACI_IFERC00001G0043 [Ferroplasma acidarmanus Fer1]|uniref:DUF1059 domain-containing protein n=2 Tax=Ferroplasma TaxID=74968 RepID=S0AKY3_FERAC|nr:hypothetical protein FACI_IFERC00001G0043 [Ferroplasma acidarmanus Fer1]
MSIIELIEMAYEFKCKDIGMDCGFDVKADSVDELIPVIQVHAKNAHNITEITPELFSKVKAAIKQD